jgi:hypothetical protein
MYIGLDKGGDHSDEWMIMATTFLDRAFSRIKMVCGSHVADARIQGAWMTRKRWS